MKNISYGCMINDFTIAKECLIHSQINGQLHFVFNELSAAVGMNKLLKSFSDADIGVIVHQDVYLPDNWEEDMIAGIKELPEDWGVAGVWGRTEDYLYHGNILDRGIRAYAPPLPFAVDTLDEVCLIFNMKTNPSFDEEMMGWDLYGTYIVLYMKNKGKQAFVIDAPLAHFTSRGKAFAMTDLFVNNLLWLDKQYPDLPILSTVFPCEEMEEQEQTFHEKNITALAFLQMGDE